MKSLSTVRAVLFDLDDTLVQTKLTRYKAIVALAERYYGYTLTEAMIDAHWGTPHHEFYAELFKEVDADLERILSYRRQLDQEFPNAPYADTKQTLHYLTGKYQVGIVTAAGREMIRAEVEPLHLPLEKLLFIQTSEDTPFHKPDPRVFAPALRLLASLGITPEQVLYVGDSLRDYQAASAAGLHFVGLADRTTPAEAFRKAGAETVSSLTALAQLL
jgi:HAD superfamily hydrolase (TIGR01549 family)